MSKVYVLQLESNKYYVGKTNDIDRRFNEHLHGRRSSIWTKRYKPIRILERINDCDCFDEDKITVKYMSKHGINNVRGGAFVTMTLSPETVGHIHKRIRMALDLCVNCGSNKHFIMECPNKMLRIETSSEEHCLVCKSRTHFTEDCEFS